MGKGKFFASISSKYNKNDEEVGKTCTMSRKHPYFIELEFLTALIESPGILTLRNETSNINWFSTQFISKCRFLPLTPGKFEFIDPEYNLDIAIFKTSLDESNMVPRLRITSLDYCFSNLLCNHITWGSCQNTQSDSTGLGWGLRFCISIQLLNVSDITGPHFHHLRLRWSQPTDFH